MTDVEITQDKLEKKARAITGHLEKRKEERVQNLRTKNDGDLNRAAKMETYDYFTQNFDRECESLKCKLNEDELSENPDRVEVARYLEEVSETYEKLRKFLNDSIVFLRPYQLQRSQTTMIELQSHILTKKETLQPRKKFAFKSKKKVAEAVKDIPTPVSKVVTVGEMNLPLSQCQVSSKTGETINLTCAVIDGNDVSLSKLQHCVLLLRGHPGTVHINDVQNCTILCGPVSGSVFVEKCTSSRIITGCQQLRIHETTNTDFYLHVTSRAIIEDSNSLRFAPYNWSYDGYATDLLSSGLRNGINNWNKVDDFNWLSKDQSPNWTVLPESDREASWSKYMSEC